MISIEYTLIQWCVVRIRKIQREYLSMFKNTCLPGRWGAGSGWEIPLSCHDLISIIHLYIHHHDTHYYARTSLHEQWIQLLWCTWAVIMIIKGFKIILHIKINVDISSKIRGKISIYGTYSILHQSDNSGWSQCRSIINESQLDCESDN